MIQVEESKKKKIKLGFYPYTFVRSIAMKALLLKKEDYHKLMKMSLNEITKFLQDSNYKKEINELANKHSGIHLIELALNKNMATSFDKLRKISPDELNLLINQYTKRKDIEDFKTILRGKFTQTPTDQIKESLIGAGTLRLDYLYKLAEMELKDVLANLKIVEFKSLEEAYKDFSENKSLTALESALDNDYYNKMLEFITTLPSQGKLFSEFLEQEIETLNILNIVRLKREKIDNKDIKKYLFFFEDPAKNKKINKLLVIDNLKELISSIEKKGLSEIVKKGLEEFEKNDSLIELEIGLYKHLLKKSVLLMHENMLSIDVILGYMFAKEIEVRNLRLLVRGKQLGLEEDFIEKQLIV